MINTMMKNKKGDGGATSLWPKIGAAVIVMVLLAVAIPNMVGQGFSSIESHFCLNVDTDGDGQRDGIEQQLGTCICNEDTPANQFYLIDVPFVTNTEKHKAQELFKLIDGSLPSRISFEDVQRLAKYVYELEACNAQGDDCIQDNKPKLVFKQAGLEPKTQSPDLNDICFSKTIDCTIEDFKEDFFVKESKYTYETACLIPNDADSCKQLRENACAAEKEEAKNADKQERQS